METKKPSQQSHIKNLDLDGIISFLDQSKIDQPYMQALYNAKHLKCIQGEGGDDIDFAGGQLRRMEQFHKSNDFEKLEENIEVFEDYFGSKIKKALKSGIITTGIQERDIEIEKHNDDSRVFQLAFAFGVKTSEVTPLERSQVGRDSISGLLVIGEEIAKRFYKVRQLTEKTKS